MGTSESAVARRVAALAAAGSIAAAGLAGAAVASESDSQDEGALVPSPQPPVEDVGGSGEQETGLPDVAPPLERGSEPGEAAPTPEAPAPTTPAPNDAPAEMRGPDAPAPESVAPAPIAPPPVPAAPSLPPAAEDIASAPLVVEDRRAGSIARLVLRRADRKEGQNNRATVTTPVAADQAAGATVVKVGLRGKRVHVVRPGDSLWSIAAALVREDADPAAVALEVQRLWRLNAPRIGTGDPDVLPVGVLLRLA
jgi:LysM domain-containing protein